ncbi:hypothetical protein ACJJTC_007880 [Scirpophaga incertulas]
MFQYESERISGTSRSNTSGSRTTSNRTSGNRDSVNLSRQYGPPVNVARRPLPPRPVCDRIPTLPVKTSVPLKVWVIASASCFAVCGALVLATVVITKWGTSQQYASQLLDETEQVYPSHLEHTPAKIPETTTNSNELNDLEVVQKLAMFKNAVANRKTNKNRDLISKPQPHPIHDTTIEHEERKIAKKDRAKFIDIEEPDLDVDDNGRHIPEFNPSLPDIVMHGDIKLPDGYTLGINKQIDYDEYYIDDNFYNDYMESNTFTNYLIEKVQELHDWISTDPDFEVVKNSSRFARNRHEFTEVLQALNESLVLGNISIVMTKLKDLYFGDNFTNGTHGKKILSGNGTDLLSFGILTLDVMLLHNIQLMAWENQESARTRMLKDPNVFAFHALFMDPGKVEARQNEIYHHDTTFAKRQGSRQDSEESSPGLLESFLDAGMSAARAAIHLGRVYKNTKAILHQKQSRDNPLEKQLSRNIDANSHALSHLQSSFEGGRSATPFTELDCLWLLYCRNLAATSKLNAPYGVMARINGIALRMIVGEVSADKALEATLFEALSGGTELKCNDLFPRCSKTNAASVVLNTILQKPARKN